MNWPALPLVRLLLPLAAGILLGALHTYLSSPVVGFMYGFLLLLLFFFSSLKIGYHYRRWFGGLLFTGMLGFGFFLVHFHTPRHHPQHLSHYFTSAVQWQFLIRQIKPGAKSIRLEGEMIALIDSSRKVLPVTGKLLLYLSPEPVARALIPGDTLLVQATIEALQPPKNPRAFDFAAFMSKKGIYHRAFADSTHWVKQKTAATGWRTGLYRLRQHGLQILRRQLPEPDNLAIAAALIMGQRDLISEETREAYTDTGAIHVLAVSGLHVGIIYLGLGWLLGLVGMKGKRFRWPRSIILVVAIWGFAFFTGGSASVLRAATMFTFLVLGEALYRRHNIYNTLAASAFLLLCTQPYLLFDVGFQLSYLAVTGIVFFQGRIYRSWYIPNRLADYLWKLASVSIAAQLTTLPISLFYFHQFPLYFWLSGWIVVPAAMIILSLGLGLLLLSGIAPLAGLLGTCLGTVIGSMNQLIFHIQQLPLALLSGIWLGTEIVLLLYLVLLNLMQGLHHRRLRPLQWALSGMIVIGIWNNYQLWQTGKQQIITVYHVYGHTAADIFAGDQAICLTDLPSDNPKLTMAAENQRAFHRIREVTYRSFEDSMFSTGSFLQSQSYLYAGHYRLLFLEKLPERAPPHPIAIDYLIIRNNAELDIRKISEYFTIKGIVFDASNRPKRVHQWIQSCLARGIPYHDIGQQGAWMLNLAD